MSYAKKIMSAVVVIALCAAITPCWSQSSRPAFEVASIRPNASTDPGGTRFDPTGINIRRARLVELIATAYQIPYSRVSTTDSHTQDLFNARYDVVAKTGQEVARDQLLVMLQTLLADRFKLTLHREEKVQPV